MQAIMEPLLIHPSAWTIPLSPLGQVKTKARGGGRGMTYLTVDDAVLLCCTVYFNQKGSTCYRGLNKLSLLLAVLPHRGVAHGSHGSSIKVKACWAFTL